MTKRIINALILFIAIGFLNSTILGQELKDDFQQFRYPYLPNVNIIQVFQF
jgi:hypothetical protein